MFVAQMIVWTATLYALLGLSFAVAFVAFGVTRIDAAAPGTSWGLRILILPGVVALWPLLAWRWWQSLRFATNEPPVERNAHR